jgi:preprotein translocase subunit SecF
MDWMKYRLVYLFISGTVILSGLFGMLKWGFKLGVDFAGGTVLEYKFEKNINEELAKSEIDKAGIRLTSIQKTSTNSYIFKLNPLTQEEKNSITSLLEKVSGGTVQNLRFETVGPSIGPEIIKKTIYAMVISATGILLWVAIQFKNIKFGISAVLAMLHDSLVVIGSFALFGHFFGAEIDLLFVTALLTILSFSVHDTIIVYDRIRESQKKLSGLSIRDLANKATTETMVRSINNTFTEIFMLVALVLLGGSTVRWFATALLIGMTSGAYSSPFVAVPILVTWDDIQQKLKGKKLFKK